MVSVDDNAYGPDLAKKTTTMAIKADEKGRRCWEEPACSSNCVSGDKRKNGVRGEVIEDKRFGGKRIRGLEERG